jgi:hypothetical protein
MNEMNGRLTGERKCEDTIQRLKFNKIEIGNKGLIEKGSGMLDHRGRK